MTVEPPDVHPSLGLIAFMHGVATGNGGYKPKTILCQDVFFYSKHNQLYNNQLYSTG